jgi:hypothetical protein
MQKKNVPLVKDRVKMIDFLQIFGGAMNDYI